MSVETIIIFEFQTNDLFKRIYVTNRYHDSSFGLNGRSHKSIICMSKVPGNYYNDLYGTRRHRRANKINRIKCKIIKIREIVVKDGTCVINKLAREFYPKLADLRSFTKGENYLIVPSGIAVEDISRMVEEMETQVDVGIKSLSLSIAINIIAALNYVCKYLF